MRDTSASHLVGHAGHSDSEKAQVPPSCTNVRLLMDPSFSTSKSQTAFWGLLKMTLLAFVAISTNTALEIKTEP